ncbi:MAG: flavoprotein [Thermoprotei archaeon ex4572_64]|nr:MAG: flavoprotein [Thermoprotei archaeon ex4572_64]
MNIAWGVCGAGHLLKESVEVIKCLLDRKINVTLYVSNAGYEVLRMYGLLDDLIKTFQKLDYPSDLIFEKDEGKSYPRTARVYLGIYKYVVISPATLNTMAKIVHGICDTLITNLVAHALKAQVPTIIVPSDTDHEVKSKVPIMINRASCRECEKCLVISKCPEKAIYLRSDGPHIDLLKCNLCKVCVYSCPKGAIVTDVDVIVKPHPLVKKILEGLRSMGLIILEDPRHVLNVV